ncbi:DNA mismatch repair protein Msh6 [Pseudovirgaria hyperparasitica]|uniref:DNA mismatch repair protein n=1 Tax=Pseudovirgaria hyperparasitica TaxID=470096 RepID=A0A6A6VZ83_9PEZI|nr:DNA mismatch repair protein Msh6 [Pseudovirgaria hyperparasitica]KAF2755000.1 DNA mismatch repair protein Msh6 [Pseudovirgaria hyperparasitica]
MARGIEGNEVATPRSSAPKKSSQSTGKGQSSIFSFFGKKPDASAGKPAPTPSKTSKQASTSSHTPKARPDFQKTSALTPAPSSDPIAAPSSPLPSTKSGPRITGLEKNKENEVAGVKTYSSPSRKSKKNVSYAESDDDDDDDEDDDVLKPISQNRRGELTKRRKLSLEDSDDEFTAPCAAEEVEDEYDVDDFVVPDESDDDVVPKKRKRSTPQKASKPSLPSSPPERKHSIDSDPDLEMPTVSTAQQWAYDPETVEPYAPRDAPRPKKASTGIEKKEKAHKSAPEARHPWLVDIKDIDKHPQDHPDYDPRTLYIPPLAFSKFSPFEKQYWEIKQKFWDTIVFFKKGKFYELYEKDAVIGHQIFDLKLTDRVNMSMVGVPESSLDHWANQFVAKGFKIARVDQMESALAKEMRERDDDKPVKKAGKEDKIIKRELSAVLTSGTLVDAGMLQDDMSTYCAAIKEVERDGLPVFGIAFVDAATAQFHLCEFVDDADMTKFETFVAQTRPAELLLEKSCISARALRIMKNNTGPTTLWNYLKPGKEFWEADTTAREMEASGYFMKSEDGTGGWPVALKEAKDKPLSLSALGALVQYLRVLKIDSDLVSLGNFQWYDPIRKASSLVLDGQSLINLEIFANSADGGTDGTLFAMLNRCVTPFGKRMLRQWVCHPLADSMKINARLDAIDALNADGVIQDRFSASLSKIPDLERLISRVHAGRCKPSDFIRVLEGFEQIEYTMGLLNSFGQGEGVIGQLISAMPDLSGKLEPWAEAFDRKTARDEGILVPEPGVEEDFDDSQAAIDRCIKDLDKLLNQARKDLGSSSIRFKDIGKEIYQLEVPAKVKNVPKTWAKMSGTAAVNRYYSPDLRKLVRKLQEAQETHAQVVKEVSSRFYTRFDQDYATWLAAVKIVAQLDCLISLAKASATLGEPSCRPTFVEDQKAVLELEDLRHPCMLNTVSDFIPNTINLGGSQANISLLTGANAAGKSTILRQTCVAVILAQIGCYLPCSYARLTPIDRIMSRLGANDNIFAAQSTFFVELSETQKILSEATPRSLVILDELGRGTSSYDGVAVAQAVLHHIASHIGCIGFFATHYHSLASEFSAHPEIKPQRMRIRVDEKDRRVTFLYKLESGVAEGSFGMHCAAMCGIPNSVIEKAEVAAKEWEHTSRLKEALDNAKGMGGSWLPMGMLSDVSWILREGVTESEDGVAERGLDVLRRGIEAL